MSIADLRHQYNKAKNMGWIPHFEGAGYGLNASDLMGIASRESNMGAALTDGKGDFRNGRWNGFGLMQVDIGSYPAWVSSGAWRNPQEAIRMGAFVLRSKLNSVKDAVPAKDVMRVAISAYNCGVGNALHGYHSYGDSDRLTTGHNYAKDVLGRIDAFAEFLAADAPLIPASAPVLTTTQKIVTALKRMVGG